jgi:hypothetical protein
LVVSKNLHALRRERTILDSSIPYNQNWTSGRVNSVRPAPLLVQAKGSEVQRDEHQRFSLFGIDTDHNQLARGRNGDDYRPGVAGRRSHRSQTPPKRAMTTALIHRHAGKARYPWYSSVRLLPFFEISWRAAFLLRW